MRTLIRQVTPPLKNNARPNPGNAIETACPACGQMFPSAGQAAAHCASKGASKPPKPTKSSRRPGL